MGKLRLEAAKNILSKHIFRYWSLRLGNIKYIGRRLRLLLFNSRGSSAGKLSVLASGMGGNGTENRLASRCILVRYPQWLTR